MLATRTGSLALLSLLPTWLVLAWMVSKARWFWNEVPELHFGWAVLLLSAYLFWEAWETKPAYELRWKLSWLGLGIAGCLVLFVTQIYQAAYGLTAASMSGLGGGMILVVMANLGYVFGDRGMRHFAFSFFFLLIALPIPSLIYSPIVSGLQSAISSLNVEILKLLGVPATQSGSLIRLPGGTVGVDEACSGIRSLQATLMATLFIGHLSLTGRFFKWILVVAGLIVALGGNLVRSLFLSWVANSKGVPSVSSFHDAAGWSILAITAVAVTALAWGLGKLEIRMKRIEDDSGGPSSSMAGPPPPSSSP